MEALSFDFGLLNSLDDIEEEFFLRLIFSNVTIVSNIFIKDLGIKCLNFIKGFF